jgi:hypothetical protein
VRETRFIAIHDKHGAIAGLTDGATDAPPASIAPGPGQALTEVEIPEDLRARLETEELVVEALREFRVEVNTDSKFVRRESPD